jgi:magnesium transporter
MAGEMDPADIQSDRFETIVGLLEAGNVAKLTRYAAGLHPADVAETLDALEDPEQKLRLFGVLQAPEASEVIRKVGETTHAILLESLGDARLSALLEHLDTDDAADLLAELPVHRRRILLQRVSPEIRHDVQDLLKYAEDTAGGIMKTEVASVSSGTTVREMTEYIRRHREDFHDLHNVFVTDARGRLLGTVPVRSLILASDETPADAIMERDVVSVRVDVDQEEVAHLFEKYELLSLPVVDSLDRLVGRITVDDVVGIIEEEATEDILRLAGVAAESAEQTGPTRAIRTRLPWLTLNLITASASAATIALFEGTIQTVAIAAALMTIVASQGGNAGNQTMTLIVRGLALGDVEPRQVLRIAGREILVAVSNGTMLGLVAGTAVYLWRGDLGLSMVLGCGILINLCVAAIAGTMVPLGLKSLGIDPAVASSVLVVAFTDILGFFTFLGLLTWIL